jgi:hypothetical protein
VSCSDRPSKMWLVTPLAPPAPTPWIEAQRTDGGATYAPPKMRKVSVTSMASLLANTIICRELIGLDFCPRGCGEDNSCSSILDGGEADIDE